MILHEMTKNLLPMTTWEKIGLYDLRGPHEGMPVYRFTVNLKDLVAVWFQATKESPRLGIGGEELDTYLCHLVESWVWRAFGDYCDLDETDRIVDDEKRVIKWEPVETQLVKVLFPDFNPHSMHLAIDDIEIYYKDGEGEIVDWDVIGLMDADLGVISKIAFGMLTEQIPSTYFRDLREKHNTSSSRRAVFCELRERATDQKIHFYYC